MKILWLCLLLLTVYRSTQEKVELSQDEEECITETGVDPELVVKGKENLEVFGDVPEYKAFISCCWRKYGYQHENGEIAYDKLQLHMLKILEAEEAIKLVYSCKDVKGATHGDTAVLVLKCLDENFPVKED